MKTQEVILRNTLCSNTYLLGKYGVSKNASFW